MPTITCTSCTGRFARGFFTNPTVSQVCRLCKQQRFLEEKLAETNGKLAETNGKLAEANNEITVLTRRLDSMERVMSLNVTRTAVTTTTQCRTPVPAPRRTSLSGVARVASPATPSPIVTNANSSHSDQGDGFQPVRNGARASTRRILPVTVYNRFQAIAEPEDGNEARIVGDSIVRGQLVEFCGRAPTKRKRFCIPGASVDDVAEAVDTVVEGVPTNGIVVIHAGTNDVMRTRSEELLEKYRRMIRKYKEKTNNIVISGILPRIDAVNSFYGKAFSINKRVKNLCLQEGIEFVDTWNEFYGKRDMFMNDGLHLNSTGSARLGRLFNNAVYFFSRMIQRQRPAR